MGPFLSHLALAEFPRDEWSSLADDRAVLPCGAGLCVRRLAAETWARHVEADPRRLALDRMGDKTLACGDTDLVLTCLDHGYGSGRFTALHLTHVIPASRLEYAYHRQLARDIGWSWGRLQALRGHISFGRRSIAFAKACLAFLGVKHRGKARRIDLAYHTGVCRGISSMPA